MPITDQLNIIQLNIKSIRNKKSILEHYINANRIDIIILSEIWLEKDDKCNISNYNIQTSCRTHGYGGVAIITRKNIRFTTKTDNSFEPIELLELSTTNLSESIKIISIYIPPRTNFSVAYINNKFKMLLDTYKDQPNTIIAGDINAHNPLWESNHMPNER